MVFKKRIVAVASYCLLAAHAEDIVTVEDEIVEKLPLKLPNFPDRNSVYFFESFQGENLKELGWISSEEEEYANQQPSISSDESAYEGDKALYLGKKHVRYGISKKLVKPLPMDEDEIIIQFETRFLERLSCSGAYLKFVSDEADSDQVKFSEKTDYVIMFGPDKCGTSPKIHAIFKHKNPISLELEEKHMFAIKQPDNDKVTHVFTLVINNQDQNVKVLVDQAEKGSAGAVNDVGFLPAFNPPDEIDDPEDTKPEDWVDDERITDPDATKPEDWVDDEFITDPESTKPEDWDEEEDGSWEPAQITNPEYKGKWVAPMIDNPDYKGEWHPRKIANPNFFTQDFPLKTLAKISHVFIEVLANDEGISFDNILITTNAENAKVLAEDQALEKQRIEREQVRSKESKREKEERERKLNEEFGVVSVLEYIAGEFRDFYTEHPFQVIGGIGVVLALFLYMCVFRSSSTEDKEKVKEAAKKKDDDISDKTEKEDEKEDENTESVEEEEEPAKSSVRRRPRKAD